MARMYLPGGRRSATAVAGKSDVRRENVWGSVVLAHGGATTAKMFTVPQGQTIPSIKGSSITVAQAHQLTHSEVTTNLTKAGAIGSAIGDLAVKSLSLVLEHAPVSEAGAASTWGAGQLELADVQSKCSFQFKVGGKKQAEGTLWMFPAAGGISGAISTTANAMFNSVVTNGFGKPRSLGQLPIQIDRDDNVEGVVGVAGGSALVFRTTSAAGAASLLTCWLDCIVRGDVR